MRIATLCFVTTTALQLSPRKKPQRSSHSSKPQLDDVDADFRRLLASGLTPTDAFTPVDVAALTRIVQTLAPQQPQPKQPPSADKLAA